MHALIGINRDEAITYPGRFEIIPSRSGIARSNDGFWKMRETMSNIPNRRSNSALNALSITQELAFSPILFQGLRCLWKLGVLAATEKAGEIGADINQLADDTGLTPYAVGVMVDAGISVGALKEVEGRFCLTKIGFVFLHDTMTHVNIDFVHDNCFEAAFHLEESLKSGKPEGLKVFGDHNTFYEGLAELPAQVKKSWYAFNHFYSDRSFPEALKSVFERRPSHIMDIGGNTGRWAIQCLQYDPEVRVTIVDLPGQLTEAKKEIKKAGFRDRVHFHEADLLDPDCPLPAGMDVIWLSQFLDCFSKPEIIQILSRLQPLLTTEGQIFIMELFVDRQVYEAAKLSLNATSLYFTFLANGKSRMYRYEAFQDCLEAAGLAVRKMQDNLGGWHTLLECEADASVT